MHELVHELFATLQKLKPQVKGQNASCMKQNEKSAWQNEKQNQKRHAA